MACILPQGTYKKICQASKKNIYTASGGFFTRCKWISRILEAAAGFVTWELKWLARIFYRGRLFCFSAQTARCTWTRTTPASSGTARPSASGATSGTGTSDVLLFGLSFLNFSPLVPDAHYSERQDNPFSLRIQQLEVGLKLNCGFLIFFPWALMG